MPVALVLDDLSLLRKLVSRVLSRSGWQVHTASTIAEAQEILRRRRIELLVLDVQLDGEDGVSFYAGLPGALQSRVLFMTGCADSARRAARTGRPVVRKPFGRAQLCAAVEAVGIEEDAVAAVS